MKNANKMAAIAVNKSLLKEYHASEGRVVYLDNGSEFQIKLFNPKNCNIAADISINGVPQSTCLVIRPGQTIWLERYLNESRKFKFETYNVEGQSDEVKAAIKQNGKITIKFYEETRPNNYLATYNYLQKYIEKPMDYYIGDSIDLYSKAIDCNTNVYSQVNGISDVNSSIANTSLSLDSFESPVLSASMACCNSSDSVSTSSYGQNVKQFTTSRSLAKKSKSNDSIETGRVEKGGYSSQSFIYSGIDLESFPFATEEITILPISRKPFYKEDLEKVYCPECGRKVKPKFKYCPFCGEKL
jgi:hypothetical protein